MMWKEFEELAGYEVSFEDYSKIIEPMYMATDLSKREFIACLDEKRFSLNYKRAQMKKQLTKEMKELAKEIKELCGYTATWEQATRLHEVAKQYIAAFPEWNGPYHELETAKGYSNCTYYTALVYFNEYGTEVKRIKLVA